MDRRVNAAGWRSIGVLPGWLTILTYGQARFVGDENGNFLGRTDEQCHTAL
jgi:hypothetical protein